MPSPCTSGRSRAGKRSTSGFDDCPLHQKGYRVAAKHKPMLINTNTMKTMLFMSLLWLSGTMAVQAQQSLTEGERQFAIDLLQRTRTDLLASVKSLSPAQLTWKADSTRWSIAQCIEHIALAEIGIFQQQQGSLKAPADPARRADVKLTDRQVVQFLTNRSGKAESPAIIRPTGRFPGPAAALRAYGQQRDKTIDYVRTTPDELRVHYWQHFIGLVDAYQTILLLAAHSERHRLQIEEVKASAGFPK
jgi:hypothetical protein